eukprot:s1722_g9.t1
MLQLTVALPSGRNEKLLLPRSSSVVDLRTLVRKTFHCGFLRLVAANGRMLDPAESLQASRLEDGNHLTAIALEVKLAVTTQAFALYCCGGDWVITWGSSAYGSDSSEVQDQLKGVQEIQASSDAFAAILADGSVVTWGDPEYGGDSSEVQDQLKGVQQIQASG